MIYVESGTFTMGSPTSETGRFWDETQHQVQLTKDFYLGKYEVTQAQYEAVMTGNTDGLSATPSNWPNNPNHPVEQVSWYDVQVFLSRLNAQQSANIPAGWEYVLPTESQWEYACRAGTSTMYSWGNTITSSNANYNRPFGQTRNVDNYAANPWGFFDMHGNVFEWTADIYDGNYPTGNPVVDPTGPVPGWYRVMRGGSWHNGGSDLRSARRVQNTPSNRNSGTGFRVALTQIESVPATGPSGLTANTHLAFGPTSMTTSGYTDSAGRAWFSSYTTSGYTLNIASDGTASLDKPDGTMETVSDINDPVPGTTGTWTIASIFNWDYVGDGGDYVSSFNLVP